MIGLTLLGIAVFFALLLAWAGILFWHYLCHKDEF